MDGRTKGPQLEEENLNTGTLGTGRTLGEETSAPAGPVQEGPSPALVHIYAVKVMMGLHLEEGLYPMIERQRGASLPPEELCVTTGLACEKPYPIHINNELKSSWLVWSYSITILVVRS